MKLPALPRLGGCYRARVQGSQLALLVPGSSQQMDLMAPIGGDSLSLSIVAAMAAAASASGIPGLIVPLTVVSAAVLGPVQAAIAVLLGVVAGSQFLFALLKSLGRDRLAARLGGRFEVVERVFQRRGLLCLIGLRVVGTPNFLVTGASALLPVKHLQFAAATALGMLPVVCVSAGTSFIL